MNYRCPNCSASINVPKLLFTDISSCEQCGQKVTLGDFFAFIMAAVSMLVTALSSVYLLSHELNNTYLAGALAVVIGLVFSVVVLLLLGRAKAYRGYGKKARPAADPTAPVKLS